MTLTNKAYLVLDNTDQFGAEGVFELRNAEVAGELDREMLLGNRGQTLTGITSVLLDVGESGSGYNVDGGAGRDVFTVEGEIVKTDTDPPRWGSDGGSLPANAEGEHPITQAQVLKNWVRTTTTDSFKAGKLHWGEWTDGRFSSSAGEFGEPVDVVVQSIRVQHPRDDPSASTASLELLRTSKLPDASDLKDDLDDLFDDLK